MLAFATALLALFLQAAPVPPAPSRPAPSPEDVHQMEVALKQVLGVYAVVEANAAEPVDSDKAFYEGAIPGMLRTLDPHSVFFDSDQFQQLQEMQNSVQRGFGSVVSVLPGRVLVLQTMPGSPSQKAGLGPGDEILAVNGYVLRNLSSEQLVELLSQSKLRKVHLVVRHGGTSGLMELTMTPAELETSSVDRTFTLKEGYGYIRLNSFDADSGSQLREAIEKLGGAKMKGLVLDLRGNPGGLLQAAIDAAGLFLPPHSLLLTAKGRIEQSRPVFVEADAKPYSFPLAVIINNRTASAAEILTGALQDHKRAKVIGERSFGKGLVQQVYPLSDGTGLALTTAFYYTPSGKSIQRPLRDVQLDVSRIDAEAPLRQAKVVGGIQPDIEAFPEMPGRLGVFLERTGLFTVYATNYLKKKGPVTEAFTVTPQILDDFQFFLSERNVRPTVAEWSAARPYLESRIKQEVFNQSIGVAKGDEVEVARDPAVRQAVGTLKTP